MNNLLYVLILYCYCFMPIFWRSEIVLGDNPHLQTTQMYVPILRSKASWFVTLAKPRAQLQWIGNIPFKSLWCQSWGSQRMSIFNISSSPIWTLTYRSTYVFTPKCLTHIAILPITTVKPKHYYMWVLEIQSLVNYGGLGSHLMHFQLPIALWFLKIPIIKYGQMALG